MIRHHHQGTEPTHHLRRCPASFCVAFVLFWVCLVLVWGFLVGRHKINPLDVFKVRDSAPQACRPCGCREPCLPLRAQPSSCAPCSLPTRTRAWEGLGRGSRPGSAQSDSPGETRPDPTTTELCDLHPTLWSLPTLQMPAASHKELYRTSMGTSLL